MLVFTGKLATLPDLLAAGDRCMELSLQVRTRRWACVFLCCVWRGGVLRVCVCLRVFVCLRRRPRLVHQSYVHNPSDCTYPQVNERLWQIPAAHGPETSDFVNHSCEANSGTFILSYICTFCVYVCRVTEHGVE